MRKGQQINQYNAEWQIFLTKNCNGRFWLNHGENAQIPLLTA